MGEEQVARVTTDVDFHFQNGGLAEARARFSVWGRAGDRAGLRACFQKVCGSGAPPGPHWWLREAFGESVVDHLGQKNRPG